MSETQPVLAGPAVLPSVHYCVRCGQPVGVPASFADLHARIHGHLVTVHPELGLTVAQLPAAQAYLTQAAANPPPST
jgi:hypothetical protein